MFKRSDLQDNSVGMLTTDVWFEKMLAYKCVSSRVIAAKFKCNRFIMTVLAVYVPCNDRRG